MNTDIQLSLTVEEVNAVLQTLGNLPTSSGAYPLMMKIKGQAEASVATKGQADAAA
jgi:hypothetical protein